MTAQQRQRLLDALDLASVLKDAPRLDHSGYAPYAKQIITLINLVLREDDDHDRT